jgi:hypothetical protein
MIRPLRNWFFLLLPIAVLVAACATTQIKSTWKDPSYQARPSKIMVIGISKNPALRRVFEDDFVQQLNAHGTKAIASYTVVPDKREGDDALVAAKLAQLGADTVLITRLVSKKTVQVYVPGTVYYPPPPYRTWRGYYGYGYQAMYTPGYIAEDEYAVIETNLYEAANNKLIWSASSETGMSGSDQKLIKSYIGIMVKTMVEQGLLGGK